MKIRRRRLLQGGLIALGSAGAIGGIWVHQTTAQTTTTCPVTTWNLTAGQYNVVGTVTVTNDNTNIYVTYTLDPTKTNCSGLGTLHVWIGDDLTKVPSNKNGIPIPGQFGKAAGGASHTPPPGTLTYTFTIPIANLGIIGITSASQICGQKLYIFTHAEVCGETAWGGPTGVNIETPGRWYYYGEYLICCGITPPPPVPTCETAFAKGGYIFTTDRKSNPEGLPTLGLSRNRWGWAIHLPQAGTSTYNIWAGAGLNKTANGRLVGTLTVDWNVAGGYVSVTYNLTAPYYLNEVHLYAGDFKPTTIAPGQYGNLAGLETTKPTSYQFTVPVADTNGDGIWLIAHAVVCSAASPV